MSRLGDLGERGLIAKFMEFIRPEGSVGPGDDAAVLKRGVTASTDVVSFDRHMAAGMTYEQFGWYSAAVSFSDLAAMGARPVGFLAALALPDDLELQAACDIMSGIDQCAEFCGTGIAGGDTKKGPGIVTGTAIGLMEDRDPMLRSGARPGDVVCVTGPLGGPAAAMTAIDCGLEAEDARQCLYVPIPRVEEGMALAASGVVTSCIDLSDSLGTSLNILCRESGVGMDLEYDFLPRGPDVRRIAEITETSEEGMLLDFGGEYELLFTADRNGLDVLYEMGVEFHIIGMVNDGKGPELIRDGVRRVIRDGRY